MSEPGEIAPARHARKRPRWLLIFAAVVLVVIGGVVTVATNTFGENVNGTVYCANGPVTGVFIEAARMPRVALTGTEVQSGFATWTPWPNRPGVADFHYWLPLGGSYSIRFGCGELKDGKRGAWATENRTPFVLGSGQQWWCDNPVNDGTTTVLVTACRSN